jgi:tRNA threonylcarbamoyladenosine biosynthesis protein TsaB
MTMIGFDTSTPVAAACVVPASGDPVCTPPPTPERLLGVPEHSAELLPVIAELLERAGAGWDDVDAIAVGVGPGTFTGLRIGVATARGLAQALRVPVHPVSSLEALAAAARAATPPERAILALIDAKRRQVFASLYRAEEALTPEWGPLALEREQLLERVRELDTAVFAVGDWAIESRPYLEAASIDVPASNSRLHAVDALQICRLGRGIEPVAPERVNPVYVRVPDAEITRSARER